jgi:hypothetical protein
MLGIIVWQILFSNQVPSKQRLLCNRGCFALLLAPQFYIEKMNYYDGNN